MANTAWQVGDVSTALEAVVSDRYMEIYSMSCSRIECDNGFFGDGCRERCNCSDGEPCDPKTGDCQKKCPPGYHGEKCQLGKTQSYTDLCSEGNTDLLLTVYSY